MFYRLPLDALPWVEKGERETFIERCTFESRPELGDIYGEIARRYQIVRPQASAPFGYREQQPSGNAAATPAATSEREAPGMEAGKLIHTALCVEPRDGKLYVFLPPVTHLEHFLDLVRSIEATAAEL